MLAGLKYRNIDKARYRVYKVTDAQLTYIRKLDGHLRLDWDPAKNVGFYQHLEGITGPAANPASNHRFKGTHNRV
jgi:hypothetical protein